MREWPSNGVCGESGGRPLLYLLRSIPAISKHGNIPNRPLEDKICLPAKTQHVWVPGGVGRPPCASSGKPARVSGDKLVEFIKLSTISLANCFPGNDARNACWRFLCPIKIDILHAHRITVVALHLGVFQGIVIFLREALW